MRTRIAAQGPLMQLPCRRMRRPRRVLRHGRAASCLAAMASRPAVSFNRPRQGCLPGRRDRLGRRDSVGLDQGRVLSRRAPRVLEWSREAAALPRSGCWSMPPIGVAAHPAIRPRRPAERHGESVPDAGASPRRTPECASIPEAAPGRRWPAWPPRPSRRIPACRPVSRSVGAPADHAAQGRLESGSTLPCGTKAALPPRV